MNFVLNAIYIQGFDDGDTGGPGSRDILVGFREITIVAGSDSFLVPPLDGGPGQGLRLIDPVLGVERPIDFINTNDLTFRNGTGGRDQGSYISFEVETAGGSQFDEYFVRLSGQPLPSFSPNERVFDYVARTEIDIDDALPGAPPGSPLAFTAFADFIRDDTPPEPLPDPVGTLPDTAPDVATEDAATLDDDGGRFTAGPLGTAVTAGAGNDVIVALAPGGNRVDLGAGGNNRVLTGTGDDVIIGGAGNDVVLAGRGGNNFIDVRAGGENRIFAGDGADTVLGGAERDVIYSGRGNDIVDGGAGDDVIVNLRGDSTLVGGAGNDVIRGGIGDTVIEGGAGADRIVAGPGRDTLVFRAGFEEDRILDFNVRSDTLDFSQHSGVMGLDDLTLRQVGANTLIDDGSGGRVVLAGIDLAVLDDAIFVFMG